MRNTSSGVNTSSTSAFSSRLLGRSCPNGFSTTTRRQPPDASLSHIFVRSIWRSTTGNIAGGIDR
jgi:hypothetical protein